MSGLILSGVVLLALVVAMVWRLWAARSRTSSLWHWSLALALVGLIAAAPGRALGQPPGLVDLVFLGALAAHLLAPAPVIVPRSGPASGLRIRTLLRRQSPGA